MLCLLYAENAYAIIISTRTDAFVRRRVCRTRECLGLSLRAWQPRLIVCVLAWVCLFVARGTYLYRRSRTHITHTHTHTHCVRLRSPAIVHILRTCVRTCARLRMCMMAREWSARSIARPIARRPLRARALTRLVWRGVALSLTGMCEASRLRSRQRTDRTFSFPPTHNRLETTTAAGQHLAFAIVVVVAA